MASPQPGVTTTMVVSAARGHLDLDLTDPDRLDEHQTQARGREDPDRLRCGCGQASQVTAAGHGADEHPIVKGVALHPHPVTEDGSPREGGRRVNREHPDAGASVGRRR